jgi:hypothetical protein
VTGNIDPWRLVAAEMATAEFTTRDAGKVRGTAVAADGSLFQGERVSINGSTDLSNVIVGNSGARVYSISLDRSLIPGVFYALSIEGQGPSGLGAGSMYVFIEDEGGFTDSKMSGPANTTPSPSTTTHEGRYQAHQLVGHRHGPPPTG